MLIIQHAKIEQISRGSRAPADILEDILGYFVFLQHHSNAYIISDSDTSYFAVLRRMSGFADRIFGYFAILLQARSTRYLVLVQYLRAFQDICRIFGAKTSDIFSHTHDKSLTPDIRESLIQDFGGGSSALRTDYKSTYGRTLEYMYLLVLHISTEL
jgi:hypothetical protein